MTSEAKTDTQPSTSDIDDDVLHFVKFRNRLGAAWRHTRPIAICGQRVGREGFRWPPPDAARCPICVELRGGDTR